MTEEKIKQNAHTYTNDHGWTWDDSGESRVDISGEISDAYLAGAHIRDEEIMELEKKVSALETVIVTARATISTQEAIIKDLRNPWISVKERLPETHEVKEGGRIFRTTDNLLLASKHGIHFGCIWLKDDGIYTFGTGTDAIKTDLWTHWMPIPQIEKGE